VVVVGIVVVVVVDVVVVVVWPQVGVKTQFPVSELQLSAVHTSLSSQTGQKKIWPVTRSPPR